MGGAHLECEDFAKSAQIERYVIENALLSFGSNFNLTSIEKKCRCIGGIKKKIIPQNLLGGSWKQTVL